MDETRRGPSDPLPSKHPGALQTGARLQERYPIERYLGRGAVYPARHASLDRGVALEVLSPSPSVDRKPFRRGARIAAAFDLFGQTAGRSR